MVKGDIFLADLAYGKVGEAKAIEIFEGPAEVKTERDIWATTGNIAIEVKYKGKPSGLSTTEAKWWIHLLFFDMEFKGGLIFPVEQLRARVRYLFDQGIAKKEMGGDDNQSEMLLVPLRSLFP
ncbi:hypothetical protein LCGC14_1672430 [marine sediment metagenome]|uniref:Uncharacterized protein n=1 Tax=marine sediment metagenome TaxID=412755 RepID=A0A0F9IDC4_9ZZZZ